MNTPPDPDAYILKGTGERAQVSQQSNALMAVRQGGFSSLTKPSRSSSVVPPENRLQVRSGGNSRLT